MLVDGQLDCTSAAGQARLQALHQLNDNLIDSATFQQHMEAIRNVEDACFDYYAENARRCRKSQPLPPESAPPPFIHGEQARAFGRAANQDRRWGVVLGVAGTIAGLAGSPLLAAFLAGAAAGAAFSATINTDAGLDADSVNLTVPEPTSPTPPHIDGSDAGAAAAEAMNVMLDNQARGLGYGGAFMAALSRAGGAALGGQPDAVDRQLAAAREFALSWAELIATAGTTRTAVAEALRDRGIGIDAIEVADILRLLETIRVDGWPIELHEMLESYGLSGAAKSDALRGLTTHLNSAAVPSSSTVEIIEAVDRGPYEQDLVAALHQIATP